MKAYTVILCVTVAFATTIEKKDGPSTTSASQIPAIHAITDEKSAEAPIVDTSKDHERKARGITIGVGGIGIGGGAIVQPGMYCV